MDILKKIAEQREKEKQLAWEGTFSEYLEIVRKRPQVAQTAHSRVYNMIISHGVEVDEQGNKRYPFFSRELFGLDRAIERLVEEYFHSAARRLDVRNHGGPHDGSTLVELAFDELLRSTRGAFIIQSAGNYASSSTHASSGVTTDAPTL